MSAIRIKSFSIAAAFSLCSLASAGFLQLTAVGTGTGGYQSYNGYTLKLDLSFEDGTSAMEPVITAWTFRVLDGTNEVYSRSGTEDEVIPVDPSSDVQIATVALLGQSFTGGFSPTPTFFKFSYGFNPGLPGTLADAIANSANTSAGTLMIGPDNNSSLSGIYTVPAPSALAALLAAGLAGRRRRG